MEPLARADAAASLGGSLRAEPARSGTWGTPRNSLTVKGPPVPTSRVRAAPNASPDFPGLACSECVQSNAVFRCLWCKCAVCESCYCSRTPCSSWGHRRFLPGCMCISCWHLHDVWHSASSSAWPALAPAQGKADSAAAELELVSVPAAALGVDMSNGSFDQAHADAVAVSGDSSPAE